MTAIRRMTFRILGGAAALMALVLGIPAQAQNSDAPIDVTAAPPTSSETVGPSQLQNFNLQGTITRQADRPPAAQAAPAATPPAASQSATPRLTDVPSTSANVGPVSARPAQSVGVRPSPVSQAPTASETATPSLPLEVRTGPDPQSSDTDSALPAAAVLGGSEGLWSWPWLAALIALSGGGAFIAWSRRGRDRGYADPGRLAFAGLVPDADVGSATPPTQPRADPVPPRAQPKSHSGPAPAPAPRPEPKPADDGLIKSTALKPELNFQFLPDRAVVTEREVLLQFDVVLTNSGAAPARDVLVEAKLVPAHAGQDQEIAAFFQQPEASGDRMAGIPPLGKVSLKSAVRLPLEQLHSFEVDGRKLFVPLVAFNILFRSSGGEGRASASFLVGRGNDDDEKLAPFRLDLGPRIFRGLSARPHSMGLTR